ncbi:MAG: hypothetical protein JXA28_13260 [Bacteroidetes bacterium]|nr:hypothetical protein [Bacteroidota bacterium]
MAHKQPFGIVDVILIVVILGLTYVLFRVINDPGQKLAFEEDMKWESRARMSALRAAQVEYFSIMRSYTADIDSLFIVLQDSMPQNRFDSLFTMSSLYLTPFNFDSVRHAPKSQQPYEIAVDDTSEVPRYRISDPDGFGYVSSLTDPDEHNKASWEQ